MKKSYNYLEETRMNGNVIVGQSGGPTAVINSSLAGVFRTAIDRGAKTVYGMRYGIQGLLDEMYVDLSKAHPFRIPWHLPLQTASHP